MSYSVDTKIIDSSFLLEEESTKGYREEDYYPVRFSEVFQGRYKVIGKLGFGSVSTVWLCHDLTQREPQKYVALKVYANNTRVNRELSIYAHLNGFQSQRGGRHFIRKMLDSFEVTGPHGKHTCLVHEALGPNLEELRDMVPDRLFSPDLARQTLRDTLRALSFLKEAGVVHTDIQPKNILMGVLDNSPFVKFEHEQQHKWTRVIKELPSRTIYGSQPMPLTTGAPKLCDFSEARFHKEDNTDLVMPDLYRAPEVILDMPWSYSIDVWGFAMTLWDVFEPKRLFVPIADNGEYSEHHHLAKMVALMGPPPVDFLERSKLSHLFWDENGKWISHVPIPETSLEAEEQRLQGEEKSLFLKLIRKALQWRPEDRSQLADVYMDEWLLADLMESGEIVRG